MASPNSVLPPQSDEEQNRAHNPGELAYLEGMATGKVKSGVDQAEAYANDPKNHDNIGDAEANPDDNINGGLYRPSAGGKKTKIVLKGLIKKKGAIAAIISLVFGAGLGFSALLSPSLLIIHMKEIMTEKFNTQLSSLDVRSTKLLNAKIDNATTGLCTKVTIRCKFSTMSAKQVTNFKNAGIEVQPAEPTNGTRTKPTGYVYKDKLIGAAEFAALSKSDPDFKAALRQAYNPKYAGFTGKAWNSMAKFFGVDKSPTTIDGETDEERMKSLNDTAQNGEENTSARKTAADLEAEGCEEDCQGKADRTNTAANDIDVEGKSGAAARSAASTLSSLAVGSLGSAIKITGAVDTYCQAYGAVKAVGYAAKSVRAIQLARYAMVFLKAGDEIKSSEGLSPETATFLGGVLTEVTYDVSSTTRRIKNGAATDSLGYKFAAFGDTTASKNSMNIANRYLAGGGFTGQLIEFSNVLSNSFPGGKKNAAATCGTLANPIVQGGSLLLGAASLLIPGVNVAKVAVGAASGIIISAGLAVLPSLLSDIIAGTVTQDIDGEESGNAITSGSGKMMADTLAGLNGNALMTKADAVAYNNLQTETIASYGNDEKLALSPLDPTSKYTFLGNIVSQLLPTSSSISDGGSILASIGSLFSTSMASIIPKTNALTTEQYSKSLNVCQDEDSVDAGYATDPFCNVIRGIPPKYLNKDPMVVVSELLRDGYLSSAEELPTSKYQDFITKCIESTDAPGWASPDTGFNVDAAKECIISDTNANQYLHYMDRNVESGMADEVEEAAPSSEATDKKSLAAKIVAKNNVTYLGNVHPTMQELADGTYDGNSEPCGINMYILKAIDAITDKHSLKISDINRHCIDSTAGGASSKQSRHYAGNGSAIDIAVIDGKATNGRDANAISAIGLAMPFLSEAAGIAGKGSQVGQKQCGAAPAFLAGVTAITDFCTHLHMDVSPPSDTTLKFTPGW